MTWRPHPKNASADPHDGPWARCDDCGFQWNLPKLQFQREWAGFTIVNKKLLKCPYCIDELQPQLRAIVLPPDPDPVYEARPEQYAIDEGLIAAFSASIAPGTVSFDPSVVCIMTVPNPPVTGIVSTGAILNGTGVSGSTIVGRQLSSVLPQPGGAGTYAVTPVQTVALTNMTTTGPPTSY